MRTYLLFVSFFLLCLSWNCKEKNTSSTTVSPPKKSLITGLASPLELKVDTTLVYLSDYFDELSEYQVELPTALEMIPTRQASEIKIAVKKADELPMLSVMKVKMGGNEYHILLKKSQKQRTKFSYDPKGKTYKKVELVGDINAWNPAATPMQLKNGVYEADIILNPGTYGYQFVLDGKWQLDEANPEKISNGMGAFNSKCEVPKPDESKLPFLVTQSFEQNTISLHLKNNLQQVYVFWNNQLISSQTEKNVLKITAPAAAKSADRSYIRVYAYNEIGLSNDVFIPLEKGKPVLAANQLTRKDPQADILYFMMVDRFVNGKKENDLPTQDKEIQAKANFFGGDLVGVTQKIKQGYFKELGMNTIWLSPIPQNPMGAWGLYNKGGAKSKFSSYHGYWPISFREIDTRFGNKQELKDLVNAAHSSDANVLLDFVAHHVHQEHPFYQSHKDWVTNLHLPDGTLNTERWDDHRLTTWFDVFLPTLDLQKPEVTEMLADSAVYWLKEYQLDGFRHDATKHIPENFWRGLTKKIKKEVIIAENRPIYQIGETYGTPELINSYISTGMLDAQFDFNLFDAISGALIDEKASFESVKNRMQESFKYYGFHHLMGNITGNQDRARFMAYSSKDMLPSEDPKLVGWTRKIEKQTPEGFKKLALLHAFNMTIPGIPVIYYGDEIGMTGANDPDNRRMMKFEGLNTEETNLKNTVTRLAKLRRSSLPLLLGDTQFLQTDENTLVFARYYFGQLSIVLFNKSAEAKTIKIHADDLQFKVQSLHAHFDSPINNDIGQWGLTLAPYSFEILTNK